MLMTPRLLQVIYSHCRRQKHSAHQRETPALVSQWHSDRLESSMCLNIIYHQHLKSNWVNSSSEWIGRPVWTTLLVSNLLPSNQVLESACWTCTTLPSPNLGWQITMKIWLQYWMMQNESARFGEVDSQFNLTLHAVTHQWLQQSALI